MPSEQRPKVPDEVVAYYNQGEEEGRLQHDSGPLEFARTTEIIQRYLPPPPAIVLDVGGAAGIYSFWLSGLGYTVHLIDATPLHIEQASSVQSRASRPLASLQVGDARQLTVETNSVDVVLLLGPLYHLTEPSDRAAALREAYRVLRPGGLLFAAVISRFASLLDGIRQSRLPDPEFARIVEDDLRSGQHRNATGQHGYFTTAYLHHPSELAVELAAAHFSDITTLAIEGPGWLIPNFEAYWENESQRAQLLQFIKTIEAEPTLMGASAHLIGIGRKTTGS